MVIAYDSIRSEHLQGLMVALIYLLCHIFRFGDSIPLYFASKV